VAPWCCLLAVLVPAPAPAPDGTALNYYVEGEEEETLLSRGRTRKSGGAGTNCIERWPLCRGKATEGCSAVRHWRRCGNDAGARALVSCSRSRFMRGDLRPPPRLLGF
jgi:hypothetical protein